MNNLKYVIRVVMIFFASYILYPLGGLGGAVWEGMKGFVQGVRGYWSGETHRLFPPWSYTKHYLTEINRMRREGE